MSPHDPRHAEILQPLVPLLRKLRLIALRQAAIPEGPVDVSHYPAVQFSGILQFIAHAPVDIADFRGCIFRTDTGVNEQSVVDLDRGIVAEKPLPVETAGRQLLAML